LNFNKPRWPVRVSWKEIEAFMGKLNHEIQKENGFFLSRAYIPEQALFGKHHLLRIDVVEGYLLPAKYDDLGMTDPGDKEEDKKKDDDGASTDDPKSPCLCIRGIPAFGRLRQCAVTPCATQMPMAHTYSTLLLPRCFLGSCRVEQVCVPNAFL